MKHLLASFAMLSMLLAVSSPAQAANPGTPEQTSVQQQKRYVIVNGVNVRLRFAPNLNSSWLHDTAGKPIHAPKGTKLTYLGQEGDFYKVKYAGNEVYISKQYSYLSDGTSTTTTKPAKESFYVVINGVNVRLRTGPGTNYPYFTWNDGSPCYLPKGSYLKYLGEQNDFYKADYQGKTVFVSKKFSYLTK